MLTFKTLRMILGISVSTMCLYACQNMGEEGNLTENLIRLTGNITPSSRVTDLDLQSVKFVSGQLVGVTIANAQNKHENVSWVADVNGYLNNMGEEVSWGTGEITIYAYHPYNTSMSADFPFTVSTDQSTTKGYLESDLLWTKKTTAKTIAPVALSFVHKLSKLEIKLQSNDAEDLSGATISVCGTHINTLFNPLTGELTPVSEKNVKDIKASVTTAAALQASCIIIPQTVASGTAFIKVEHEGKTYQYKLSESATFEEGKSYIFTLTINKENPGDVGAVAPDMPWS